MPVYVPDAFGHFLGSGCGDKFSPLPVPFPLLTFCPALSSAFGAPTFMEPFYTGSSHGDHPCMLPAFHKSRLNGTVEKRRITPEEKVSPAEFLRRGPSLLRQISTLHKYTSC